MKKKVLHILQLALSLTVLTITLLMTTMLLQKVLAGTGVPESPVSKSVDAVMMDRFDMYMNNEISNALDGVLVIEKTYWLIFSAFSKLFQLAAPKLDRSQTACIIYQTFRLLSIPFCDFF